MGFKVRFEAELDQKLKDEMDLWGLKAEDVRVLAHCLGKQGLEVPGIGNNAMVRGSIWLRRQAPAGGLPPPSCCHIRHKG